jgi:hypothetical protein
VQQLVQMKYLLLMKKLQEVVYLLVLILAEATQFQQYTMQLMKPLM